MLQMFKFETSLFLFTVHTKQFAKIVVYQFDQITLPGYIEQSYVNIIRDLLILDLI